MEPTKGVPLSKTVLVPLSSAFQVLEFGVARSSRLNAGFSFLSIYQGAPFWVLFIFLPPSLGASAKRDRCRMHSPIGEYMFWVVTG